MLRYIGFSGLLLALTAATSFAQPGGGLGGLGGMRMPASMLLMMPEVQKEIQVTDDQKTKLDDLRAEQMKDMQSQFQGFDFGALRDMSQEERDKKIAELRKKGEEMSKQIDEKVGKVLDATQMKRLGQLQIQRDGIGAFSRPEVVSKL